jgi:hypothetical protein
LIAGLIGSTTEHSNHASAAEMELLSLIELSKAGRLLQRDFTLFDEGYTRGNLKTSIPLLETYLIP